MEDSMAFRRCNETNKHLVPILQAIYPNEVTLNKASKKNITILKEFLFNFKAFCATTCPLFNRIFNEFYFTGSAFEGLQVKEAIEFDINVVMYFPFPGDAYRLEELKNPWSFAMFQLNQPISVLMYHDSQSESLIGFESLFDTDNFLIGKKLSSWFQSLVDKYIKSGNFRDIKFFEKIKRTNSGPACTLKIKLVDAWISIDLVPVFGFNTDEHLQQVHFHDHVIKREVMSRFCLVPKPVKEVELNEVNTKFSSRLWRIHFPEAEKRVLIGRTSLKPLIKLVKSLRDKETWPIPSYFIKTVAIWIVSRHPDHAYFADSEIGARFLEMLECLCKHLHSGHLGHIFYPKFNLFQRMHIKSRTMIGNRLQKIINELHKNPSHARTLFKCSKYSPCQKVALLPKSKLKSLLH